MTNFDNTSHWQKESNSTITYRYDFEGKPRSGKLEKEPRNLLVAVERLSVVSRTAWTFVDEKQEGSATGFLSGEFVRAKGKLDLSKVHAFAIGGEETAVFDQIEVSIFPRAIEELRATSTQEKWSLLRDSDERPEDGWLKDELGRLDADEADEYGGDALLSAMLWLDQETFDRLVHNIKTGGMLKAARLDILADLFQFGYEAALSSPFDTQNFGLLCEVDDSLSRRYTKARIQELSLEWAPTLSRPKPEDEVLDELQLNTEFFDGGGEDVLDHLVGRVATDVRGIRARMDFFFQLVIVGLLILVIDQVLGWLSI